MRITFPKSYIIIFIQQAVQALSTLYLLSKKSKTSWYLTSWNQQMFDTVAWKLTENETIIKILVN